MNAGGYTAEQSQPGTIPKLKNWDSIYPNWWVAAVLLIAWSVLFHFTGNSTLGYIKTRSLFVWWYEMLAVTAQRGGLSALVDSEDALAWLIPLIVAGLFYYRRKELAELEKKEFLPASVLLIIAVLVHILGFLVQQARLSFVAFWFGVYAITGMVWGKKWLKETLFIFALFAFSVPLGGASEAITFPLRVLATTITVKFTNIVFGLDIIQHGTLILDSTGRYQYEVAPACGGLRSLTAIFVLAIVSGYILFRSLWRKLLLIVLSLPLAVAGNILRLLGIIIAAELAGQEAGAKVHSSSIFSLLPYVPAFVVFWFLTAWLKEEDSDADKCARMDSISTMTDSTSTGADKPLIDNANK